jgi:hypothetical protein
MASPRMYQPSAEQEFKHSSTSSVQSVKADGQYLIDEKDQIWDWRDPKGNWTNRAQLEAAYANFILTQCGDYWRPAFLKFNKLMLEDFNKKTESKEMTSESKVFLEKVVTSLRRTLDSFEESLGTTRLAALYAQLKSGSTDQFDIKLIDEILNELLLNAQFRIDLVDQFYFELTLTASGVEHAKPILPLTHDAKSSVSDKDLAAFYEQSQPAGLYGPKADPALRGRVVKDKDELAKSSAGRPGFTTADNYSVIEAPTRHYRHFSASVFYKIMPEDKSSYVKNMHDRGFNVNAGPSGTMGRIQLLLKLFMTFNCLTADEARQITLAVSADFVRRGQHTFVECMQSCQAKPLENTESCFGLFKTPTDMLVTDPRAVYEQYFLQGISDRPAFRKFSGYCDDLFQPKEKYLFPEGRILPAI